MIRMAEVASGGSVDEGVGGEDADAADGLAMVGGPRSGGAGEAGIRVHLEIEDVGRSSRAGINGNARSSLFYILVVVGHLS